MSKQKPGSGHSVHLLASVVAFASAAACNAILGNDDKVLAMDAARAIDANVGEEGDSAGSETGSDGDVTSSEAEQIPDAGDQVDTTALADIVVAADAIADVANGAADVLVAQSDGCAPPPPMTVGCSAVDLYAYPQQYCTVTPNYVYTIFPTPPECLCNYVCSCLLAHTPCPTGQMTTSQSLGVTCETGSTGGIALGCANTGTDAPSNGPCTLASCGAQSACVMGACTPARRVFVSSAVYQGNLGGLAGGDSNCQVLATNAGLGGTWRAWLSDGAQSPSTRFTQATVAYRLLDGTVVAAGWSALVAGTLAHAINLDETGSAVMGVTQVWTGTTVTGTSAGFTCLGFTSNTSMADTALLGVATAIDMTWTYAQQQYCNFTGHLYCFEQ